MFFPPAFLIFSLACPDDLKAATVTFFEISPAPRSFPGMTTISFSAA
jgi:hypothetical protein